MHYSRDHTHRNSNKTHKSDRRVTEQKLPVLLHQDQGSETQQSADRDGANCIIEALACAVREPGADACKQTVKTTSA